MADNTYILRGYPTGQSVEDALNKGKQSITEEEVLNRLADKQNLLSSEQMQAVNSGITATGYNNLIDSVQNINSKVIANLPAGQSLNYGSYITIELNPETFVVTAQLWDQQGNKLGNASTIDLPLESFVVDGYYEPVHKQLVLILKNDRTVIIPMSALLIGLQPLIDENNKLNADYVDDSESTNKFITPAMVERLMQSVNKVKMDGLENISGLTIETDVDRNKIITHTNNVDSVDLPTFAKVAYDRHGHITQTTAVTKTDIADLGLDGSDIGLTGYQKASTVRPIAADDDVTTALGILEKAVETPSSGTVRSVAVTVPTGLSVTGSPITTEGTIAIGLQSGYTIPTIDLLNSKVSARIDEEHDTLILF